MVNFPLRPWTPNPKMDRAAWEALVPTLRTALEDAYGEDVPPRPKVWHDNERFLLCPDVYKDNCLSMHRFPPNSGDLNPIETVWAKLRKDLAEREFEDLKRGKLISKIAFKQRVAQLLTSYSIRGPGEKHSYLEKLVRGMPRRLARCKSNKYGPCGK